jgi:hypothetical protein
MCAQEAAPERYRYNRTGQWNIRTPRPLFVWRYRKSQRSPQPQLNRLIDLHVVIGGSHARLCVDSHDLGSS